MSQAIPEVMSGAPEIEGYVSIATQSLVIEKHTAFNLYLLSKDSSVPVLYCEANVPLEQDERLQLLESGNEALYVKSSDHTQYRRYTEENLGVLLKSDALNPTKKIGILYESAHTLVGDVFDDPRSGESIERSRKLVEHTVDYLMGQGNVVEHLQGVIAHDYHIYTHSVNVCVFGLSLALKSGLSDVDILKEFGDALLLHDVGKSQIDPEILKCPGKLTGEQFDEMKMHTIYGYQILSGHPDLSPVVLDVTRHHHEKLNGRGYPDKLSGDKISELTRICTIADIFDALTTRRVYKEALTTFDALQLMRNEEGEGLDTEHFRNFVQMMGN